MNTKRLFQSMACAVLAFAVTAPVLARENDHRGRDRDRSSHYDRRDDRRDDRRNDHNRRQAYGHGYSEGPRDDRRYDNRHYDDRRYYAPPRVTYRPAPGYHRWAKGQRYRDYYGGPVYVVNDYNRYQVRHPPRGYHWVRDDRGNLLMVAIATGVIADLMLRH